MTNDPKDQEQVHHHEGQGNPIGRGAHDGDLLSESRASAYWRANLRFLGTLLAVWFAVSFGAGVLLADTLDRFTFLGFPLGFWFAQQGAIYIFVGLIFVYVIGMQRLDHTYGVDDDGDPPASTNGDAT